MILHVLKRLEKGLKKCKPNLTQVLLRFSPTCTEQNPRWRALTPALAIAMQTRAIQQLLGSKQPSDISPQLAAPHVPNITCYPLG